MTMVDSMRAMATAFDSAASSLRAADDVRREVSFLAGEYSIEASRSMGKDFDLVLRLGDELDDIAARGQAAASDAVRGARSVLEQFDAQQLPVHMQSRIEVGGARELLANAEAVGWGANLESVGHQFTAAARAIEGDIAARLA